MKKTRIAISGINGFVGHHLARELVNNNIAVIGIGHDNHLASSLDGVVDEYYSTDLINEWPAINNIHSIIHLAGLAAVGPSFDNPQRYINGNSAMITNMCEYYVKQEKKPRIIIVSSGAIYNSNQSMPIAEDGLVGFSSPYAVSKVLVENQAKYYHNRGLECVVARPFNHIGPGQDAGFLIPDLYLQLRSAQQKNQSSISVGNIDTRRDYTDVRDIVRAYRLLATTPGLSHDLYNICTGRSISGTEILSILQDAIGISNVTPVIDQTKVRPTDAMEIYGNASRLYADTGWQPEIKIDQTIKDFINTQV